MKDLIFIIALRNILEAERCSRQAKAWLAHPTKMAMHQNSTIHQEVASRLLGTLKLKVKKMNMEDISKISFGNREAVEKSTLCGCYHCGIIFAATEIINFIVEKEKSIKPGAETAICPSCGIDSIVPDASTDEDLTMIIDQLYPEKFGRRTPKGRDDAFSSNLLVRAGEKEFRAYIDHPYESVFVWYDPKKECWFMKSDDSDVIVSLPSTIETIKV